MTKHSAGSPEASLHRKTRGAFFTPPRVSKFLAEWAVRSDTDRILEPSCGEASFLLAADARLKELRREAPLFFQPPGGAPQLVGSEIHRDTAQTALQLLAQADASFLVREEDFFA